MPPEHCNAVSVTTSVFVHRYNTLCSCYLGKVYTSWLAVLHFLSEAVEVSLKLTSPQGDSQRAGLCHQPLAIDRSMQPL